jgi:hypothetical protein
LAVNCCAICSSSLQTSKGSSLAEEGRYGPAITIRCDDRDRQSGSTAAGTTMPMENNTGLRFGGGAVDTALQLTARQLSGSIGSMMRITDQAD